MFKNTLFLIVAILLTCFSATARKMSPPLRMNSLRIAPLTTFYDGTGGGLSYGRILDKTGRWELNIPVYIGLRTSGQGYYNGITYGSDANNYAILFSPGVRYYVLRKPRFNYGIGIALFGATGSDDFRVYDWNNPTSSYELMKGSMYRMGMLVQNSFDFNITDRMFIGAEIGLGPSYINHTKNKTTGYSRTTWFEFMPQATFNIGFRF